MKEICLFYVDKVSGEYANHPAAARYVHTMAEEIILQLAGVASEIKKNRGEPELYAALLEEWQEHFPASLASVGTPKAIAALLQQQSRDIAKLKSELEHEKLHRDSDISGVLRSMDAQLHAYRVSVLHDRRQMTVLHDNDIQSYKDKLDTQQRLHQEFVAQLKETHHKDMQVKRNLYEKQAHFIVTQKNLELQHLRKTFQDKAHIISAKMRTLQEKILMQKVNYSALKSKYHALAKTFSETVALSDSDNSDSDDNHNNNASDNADDEEEELHNALFALEHADMEFLLADDDDENNNNEDNNDDNSSISSHHHHHNTAADDQQALDGDEDEQDVRDYFHYTKKSHSNNNHDNNHNNMNNSADSQSSQPRFVQKSADMLQALTQFALEKKQAKLAAKQQREAFLALKEQEKTAKLASLSAEKQALLAAKENRRQDMQKLSKSVLSGDFSSVGNVHYYFSYILQFIYSFIFHHTIVFNT